MDSQQRVGCRIQAKCDTRIKFVYKSYVETHQVNNERPRYTLLILYAKRRIPPTRRLRIFSVASKQSTCRAVISDIEREFGVIFDAIHEFPNVIEDRYDEF